MELMIDLEDEMSVDWTTRPLTVSSLNVIYSNINVFGRF